MPADAEHMLVRYTIESEDGSREVFELDIDLPQVAIKQPDPSTLPEWAELVFGIPAILLTYGWVIWRKGFGPEDRVLFRRNVAPDTD